MLWLSIMYVCTPASVTSASSVGTRGIYAEHTGKVYYTDLFYAFRFGKNLRQKAPNLVQLVEECDLKDDVEWRGNQQQFQDIEEMSKQAGSDNQDERDKEEQEDV